MKSITIHNLDDDLTAFIESKAKEWDLSLNKTIKKLLRRVQRSSQYQNSKSDEEIIKSLAGSWTQEEHDEFEKNTEWFRRIDEDLWK